MVKIKCGNCGSLMPYFPDTNKFVCLNCGKEKPGSYFYTIQNRKSRRYYEEDF